MLLSALRACNKAIPMRARWPARYAPRQRRARHYPPRGASRYTKPRCMLAPVPDHVDPAHAALALAAAAGVTAARQALLRVWPDFAAASRTANDQARGSCART